MSYSKEQYDTDLTALQRTLVDQASRSALNPDNVYALLEVLNLRAKLVGIDLDHISS